MEGYKSHFWGTNSLSFAIAVLTFAGFARAGTGQDLMNSIRNASLDAAECYRVRDISIARDEVQLFFTDGYLIFGKPVGSTRVTAVFSADVEGGDGELLLLPPNHAERRSPCQTHWNAQHG